MTLPTLRARAHYEADKRALWVKTHKVPLTKFLELQAYTPGGTGPVVMSPAVALTVPVASTSPTPNQDPGFDPDDMSAECVCGQYPRCVHWCVVAGGDGQDPALAG